MAVVDSQHTLDFADFDEDCTNHEVEVISEQLSILKRRLQSFGELVCSFFVVDLGFRAELASKCCFVLVVWCVIWK